MGWAADGADQKARLAGRVVDENKAAVAGVQLTLRPQSPGAPGASPPLSAVSDPTGAFAFEPAPAGEYVLSVERQGFFRIQNRTLTLAPGDNDVAISLDPTREVFERVDVSYSPKAIDFDRTQPQEQVTDTQLLEVPYPSTNTIRNAMRILPGRRSG